MPVSFDRVYLQSAGYFMPGEPVGNDEMDAYIAPLNRMSSRIQRRILAENGIKQRYYAIDKEGGTVFSNAQLAAGAIRDCLARGGSELSRVSLMASGSSGGDTLMPGFANMIQGELAAPPMETISVHGICAAGVSAIQVAAQGIELGAHRTTLAVASEMPSRLFKRSRFAARGYETDFDSHFLRWMLSDGAGALLLSDAAALPGAPGLQLKLKWVHQRAFSGDYPVCMQLGLTEDRQRGHLDFASWGDAEAAGALSLRQDIRLLPHLFDIGIHEYARLVHDGWLEPQKIDHFLCHYSSEKFIPVVEDLMRKAGLAIPRERWYSNLAWRGNTGAASILIMLAEFMQTRTLEAGQQIFCYVPESGRFMAAYMLLEVQAVGATPGSATARAHAAPIEPPQAVIAPPHDPATAPAALRDLLTELASIWHDYRSQVWRTPLVRRIRERRFAVPDYLNWMENWIPQVREGSLWMREGAASLSGPFQPLAALIGVHAGEEQNDFRILFDDYRKAGGPVADIDDLRRNPGGEALNAYLHRLAATRDPFGLLGAIYIIEGTGQRIVPALLPLLRAGLPLPPDAFRFLEYHGHNDEHHLG
ncbi:MAG: 3-oxoacyl-[acyl-carrier-protein] synthase III C-terminal domain-containing protein, partial [Variovorax sp.]